jgi:N-acetylglucosaminyldiphosphoundecaprenol N-acetyl-beta-D-mannosaminyltransferase
VGKMAERVSIVGVPVDICQPDKLENEIMEILAKPGTKQIIFLSIWDLLKARRKGDFADCVKSADLVIPISKSILRAAAFLKKPVPVRYNPFNAVIQILSVLDSHFKTIYLLGSSKKTISKVEHNIKDTFA